MISKHKISFRRLLFVFLLCVCSVVTLGLIAPLINVSRFSGVIQRNIEASLGRRLHFSAAHFTLLTGPGFSLEDVTIEEDPRYGLEPFAHASALEAHLRLDKLVRGKLQFSSLRLSEPSLNLVQGADGSWNVVGLLERVGAPRRAPLNLFPAFEISDARVNFKLESRKTTLYIADADLSVYPERSGKLYVRFSGSPARSDRAGNGFGHLHGSANWYLTPATRDSNQLEANLTIDPSDLSELATLIEGYDIGVHGTVSSQLKIEGPVGALRIRGQLRLEDVHRWDLLPSSGERWRIGYQGRLDLSAHTLRLETLPERSEPAPVALELQVRDLLARPAWALQARLNDAPARELLPLIKRMGFPVPQQLGLEGAVSGALSYSKNCGLQGGVFLKDAVAALPNLPLLRTALATASIWPDHIHLEPAALETPSGGALHVSGDYYFSNQRVVTALDAEQFSVDLFKRTAEAWFGAAPGLQFVRHGTVSGALTYSYAPQAVVSWSGQFQFAGASVGAPAFSTSLDEARGRITFDNSSLSLDHFSALLGDQSVYASYRYNASGKHPERLHIEMPAADLLEIETALDPLLRGQSLLTRLRLTRRSIPAWLAERNLDGDLDIGRLSVKGADLGPFSARFAWRGANVTFSSLQLHLAEGLIRAQGGLNLAAYAPAWNFAASASGFAWRGGLLSAEGEFHTLGTGLDSLRNLQAAGTFSGDNVQVSGEDTFNTVSGNFEFSFTEGWPNLRLSKIQADDGEDEWNGEAVSQSDGKLIVDLEHDGQQRRVISTLRPAAPQPATLTSTALPQ